MRPGGRPGTASKANASSATRMKARRLKSGRNSIPLAVLAPNDGQTIAMAQHWPMGKAKRKKAEGSSEEAQQPRLAPQRPVLPQRTLPPNCIISAQADGCHRCCRQYVRAATPLPRGGVVPPLATITTTTRRDKRCQGARVAESGSVRGGAIDGGQDKRVLGCNTSRIFKVNVRCDARTPLRLSKCARETTARQSMTAASSESVCPISAN